MVQCGVVQCGVVSPLPSVLLLFSTPDWLLLLLPLLLPLLLWQPCKTCCTRLRSMSCKALVTRVRRITNVGKLLSFVKVSAASAAAADAHCRQAA